MHKKVPLWRQPWDLFLSLYQAREAALLLPCWPATLLALPLQEAALVELELLALKYIPISATTLSWPG